MNESLAFLLVLCAFWGYRYSARTTALRGTTPWHVPSVIWAVVCLATGPFGLVVEYVAVRTTKPAPLPTAGQVPGGWSAQPISIPFDEPIEPEPTVPAANDGSGKVALFGWYPDPTGRHERRYWDGRGWTGLIEDHLVTGNDPL